MRLMRLHCGLCYACSALFLLTSCQTPATAPPVPAMTKPAAAVPAHAQRYRIDAALSDVRLLVYRAGPLARLGHNHVIQARDIRGEVLLAPELKQSVIRLTLPVAGLRVDDVQARKEEGEEFASEPDAEAIAGTRRNMLGDKVLNAAAYPEIAIQSVAVTGPAWMPDVTLRIRLHGLEREVTVPVALQRTDDRLTATAAFDIRQSDFGITPLSVLGGGLQVADTVRVRLKLIAVKEP